MLRGVHRQIIEINQPQSNYFEKVLLFVNPNCPNISQHQLQMEARRVVQHLGGQPTSGQLRKTARKRRFWWMAGACTALLLTAATIIFMICS